MTYFVRYIIKKPLESIEWYYSKLNGNIEEHKGRKHSIFNDVFLTDIIHIIEKSVGIDNFKDTKLLVNTDDHLLSAISISQAVLFINCVVKKIMNIICKYF